MQTSSSSITRIMFIEPSLEDPTTFEEVYPCRCGVTHRGEDGRRAHRNHECFHPRLEIIDTTVDGDFVVYCRECESAWIAPCVAEGISLQITKAANQRGCANCRQLIMSLIKNTPDLIDFDCPDCGEQWSLRKG